MALRPDLDLADGTLVLAAKNGDAQIYRQCMEQAERMYGLEEVGAASGAMWSMRHESKH